MKQDELEKNFDLELEVEQLEDKIAPGRVSPFEPVGRPWADEC
jgi:hypothetical protein